ncbi:BON domain-containing protein [Cryobacterium sp. SO2]|uniref:BON domain-containing protein n=1 Tax=Cryobacterium sp. SO2 TaxID=1897060 RepID=UPI00223CA3CE|nr:BON domain-containing protein [Cryobacterium sp. SO2]WEO77426.1 BON domain-containing protein [Cryobacterium sp. SO2]
MNGTFTSAHAAGTAPARLAVAVPQLRHPMSRSTRSTYKRLLRRETHSPRSVVAIGLASVIIAGCLYSGTELVLELLNRPALLAAPTDVVRYVSQVNDIAPAALLALGIIVAIAGAALVLVAVLPGRRARREVASDRAAVVVDDEVIAASLERRAAVAGNVAPENIDVTVSRHRATVQITPESGTAPDRFTAEKAIADALAYDSLRPALAPTVVINPTGRVSA